MQPISIVLCPIDFSDVSRQALRLAIEVCQACGAQLVLHHNLDAVARGFAPAWEIYRGEPGAAAKAEEGMRQILAELPKTMLAKGRIGSGPLETVLLDLAAELPADLIVLGSHGWSTAHHASVTEGIIARCPCPVLTLRTGAGTAERFRLRTSAGEGAVPVVVATDLSDSALPTLSYAFELARTFPIRLHLLHVVTRDSVAVDTEAVRRQVAGLVPVDLRGHCEPHVRQGDAVEHIVGFSHDIGAAFTVLGEHARGFLRGLVTQDSAREVLHRAPCPVWFIPSRR